MKPLVDPQVSALFAALPYAAGHTATGNSIAGGIIYYAIASLAHARVCVCLGSGGGFVPCLMRQAQRELNIDRSVTYLVDAILPEAGFGGPEVAGGWRNTDSLYATQYPEIVTLNCLTQTAGKGFFRKNEVRIDYLHIDAEHSYAGALGDFETFLPLLNRFGFVTFHDTNMDAIRGVLDTVSRHYREFDCLDLQDFGGAGLAILRRNMRRTH